MSGSLFLIQIYFNDLLPGGNFFNIWASMQHSRLKKKII